MRPTRARLLAPAFALAALAVPLLCWPTPADLAGQGGPAAGPRPGEPGKPPDPATVEVPWRPGRVRVLTFEPRSGILTVSSPTLGGIRWEGRLEPQPGARPTPDFARYVFQVMRHGGDLDAFTARPIEAKLDVRKLPVTRGVIVEGLTTEGNPFEVRIDLRRGAPVPPAPPDAPRPQPERRP